MSRLTIDELEVLTPDQLGELLIAEVQKKWYNPMYIDALLVLGCPIDFKDEFGRTALHWAARYLENTSLVKFLISRGANIQILDKYLMTPYDIHWIENRRACKSLIVPRHSHIQRIQ